MYTTIRPNQCTQVLFGILVLAFITMFNTFSGIAQASYNTEWVGSWSEGPRQATFQQDSILFMNSGGLLEIYEILEDTTQLVSTTETRGFINDIYSDSTFVYLAIEGIGLSIFDVSNLMQPVESGFLPIYGYYGNLQRYGNYLFYATNSSVGLHLIDISNSAAPVLLKSLPFDDIRNMAIMDQYLFTACRWDGFSIYRLDDPMEPVNVYSNDETYTYDVDVAQNVAAIVQADTLLFLDITNPESPKTHSKIGIVNLSKCKLDLTNERAIAAGYTAYLIDLEDITNPQILNVKNLGSYTEDMSWQAGRITFMTDQGGAQIFRLNESDEFETLQHIPTVGNTVSVALYHDYAFLAHNYQGFTLLDISQIESPMHIKSFLDGESVTYLRTVDHYLLCSSNGLKIFDIADPLNPVQIGNIDLSAVSQRFRIRDNLLYLASGGKGLVIIDITDYSNPEIVGTYDSPGYAYNLDLVNDIAYLADGSQGLSLIDITNPGSPNEIMGIDSFWMTPLKSIQIFGNTAWIGSTNFGIRIIDITDLNHPTIINNLNTSRGHDMLFHQNYAYIAAGFEGCYILEYRDVTDPQKVAFFNSNGKAYDIAVREDLVYMANYETGLTIFRFDKCSPVSLETTTMNSSCFGVCDGSISIDDVENGLEPFQYNWSDGSNIDQLNDLCAGEYSLTVTDAQGCNLYDTFAIQSPPMLTISEMIVEHITDSNPNASIQVTVAGGTPGYTYLWQGPDNYSSVSSSIYFLQPGCYTLTVTDANGCVLESEEVCIEDQTTALFETDPLQTIICSPNPAKDYLKLLMNPENGGSENPDNLIATIYNGITGEILLQCDQKTTLDISNVPNGFYLLKISRDKQEIIRKIVIQR